MAAAVQAKRKGIYWTKRTREVVGYADSLYEAEQMVRDLMKRDGQ